MSETTKKDELPAVKVKPIDIVNNLDQTFTPVQVEKAWVATISAQPAKAWLKNTDPQNPDNKFMKDSRGNLIPYIPIEILEMLMDKLLMHPQIKITQSGLGNIATEKGAKTLAYMNIELKYYDHGIKEWKHTDGTASMEVAGNFQWALAFPKLKAEAYKNACKNIGNLFGRRLLREDMVVGTEDIVVTPSKKQETLNALTGGAQ